jgi:hypothetical protein
MAKRYIARKCRKQFAAFELQSPAYADHGLAVTTSPFSDYYPFCYLKAEPRDEEDAKQTFIIFPETLESTDTFRIFNQSTGKAWTKVDHIIFEQEFKPNDKTKSQVFTLQEILPGSGAEIQFPSDWGVLYGCQPKAGDHLIARAIKEEDELYGAKCSNFLVSFGDEIPSPNIKTRGNLESQPPDMTGPKQPTSPPKPFAVRALPVPFFMVEDKEKDSAWKAQNSPWYYLRRQAAFVTKPEWFISNSTSAEQECSWKTIRTWSKEQSESFSKTVGVSVSTEVSFFGNGVDIEVSVGLGFSSGTSLTTTTSEEENLKLKAPSQTAITMWRVQNTIALLRADGTKVKEWIRGFEGAYYSQWDFTKKKAKQFIMQPNEDRARTLSKDGEIGDFASLVTRTVRTLGS